MKEFVPNKARFILMAVLLLLTMLGLGLQQAKSAKENSSVSPTLSQAEVLYQYKTPYVGDNGKVVNLIDSLPYANLRQKVYLQTQTVPYGITVDYDFSNAAAEAQQMEVNFRNNAAIMFALIENVDEITFVAKGTGQPVKYHYERAKLQKEFARDLRHYAKDIATLQSLLEELPKVTAANLPNNLDTAVSQAIIAQGKGYKAGEVVTEGHVILETEESNGKVKVYTIASLGWFAFENNIFTKTSGSGAIPTVITFAKNEKGEYALLTYEEPQDGAYYVASLKKMFPRMLQARVLDAQSEYANLAQQQEAQAAAYLKGIGREAQVSAAHVEKELADIDVQAKNKLFAELTKDDEFLNNCPYWLGTREQIEDGVRYIYETSQSKTKDGYHRITFRKLTEDHRVVKEQSYKIVGSEPVLE
ncbi:DUF4825 domain-containing protein [Desulforamulus ferrireducens]|uniref:DUF4825 domain-containing protein n=1 Tax=Desulforamulus ferrireducens TaxID=1833852 RepID=UPI00098B1005|nr:DUF4825 domain-containing protein [Desulforamulus ferrireducens]